MKQPQTKYGSRSFTFVPCSDEFRADLGELILSGVAVSVAFRDHFWIILGIILGGSTKVPFDGESFLAGNQVTGYWGGVLLPK